MRLYLQGLFGTGMTVLLIHQHQIMTRHVMYEAVCLNFYCFTCKLNPAHSR